MDPRVELRFGSAFVELAICLGRSESAAVQLPIQAKFGLEHHGPAHTHLTVLAGGKYALDLRTKQFLDLKVSFEAQPNEVVIRAAADGAGDHTILIRSDNLAVSGSATENVHLAGGAQKETVWHAHVVSAETPWVALVIPDGEFQKRVEVSGVIPTRP